MPEFSIIIPCYNCAKTLEETIGSVLSQSFCDFEIIAVNDGSTDDTAEILRMAAIRDPERIRIHMQSNAGVSAARNQAIRMSSGRYILFLDADDLLAEGLLASISRSLKKESVDTLCFYYTRDFSVFDGIPQNWEVKPITVSSLLERLTYSKRDVLFCSFVYKAELLRKHMIQFEEGFKYGEDWEFSTKYLSHCTSAVLLDKNGYFYRSVKTSAMAQARYDHVDAIAAAERTYAYLLSHRHPFAETFWEYMYPRAVFSVAHRFGQVRNRELFMRLQKEYDLKAVMKRMIHNPNVDVKSKLAAASYLVSPWLYYLISIF